MASIFFHHKFQKSEISVKDKFNMIDPKGSRSGDRLLPGEENENIEEVTELKDQIIDIIDYSDD
jgi:hypothetical protein